MSRCAHVIRLLIRERGSQGDEEFIQVMGTLADRVWTEEPDAQEMAAFAAGAQAILQRERAAIAKDPGVWREVWISLGLDAVAWPAWLRRPTQGDPDLP
jgi:hypothetical protein